MSLYGVEPWTSRGDAFAVYFNLFARLSPLDVRGGRVVTRKPLIAVVQLTPVAGTVALLCTMIGTTSFDGFSQGSTWNSLAPHLQSFFLDLGLNAEHALKAAVTVGLVALPLAMAFAIASGLTPQAGIYCAVVTGFLVSALGGSRVQIAGPTGAFVVVAGIVTKYGVEHREAKRLDRFGQFGMAASVSAVKDAGIDFNNEDRYRCGVIIDRVSLPAATGSRWTSPRWAAPTAATTSSASASLSR